MTAIGAPRAQAQSRFVNAARVTRRIAHWQLSVGTLALVALIMWRTDSAADADRTLASIFAAAGLAPILVDAAAMTLASSPTPRRARLGHRLVWVTPAVVFWIATQWILISSPRRPLPPRWAWLELTTLLAIVLSAELTAARTTRSTGLAGVAALLLFVGAVAAASRHVAMLPTSEHELRFAVIGAIAVAMCCITSRDSALRLNRQRRSHRQSEKEQSISGGSCKSEEVGSSPQSQR